MLGTINLALAATTAESASAWHTILWLAAVALVVYGIYLIAVRRQIGLGIVLIILGLLIGPGGVSLLS